MSNAERAELRASLERRARDMARDFDREVTTLQDLVRSEKKQWASVADAIKEFRQQAGSGAIRMSDAVDAGGATMAFYEPVHDRVTAD